MHVQLLGAIKSLRLEDLKPKSKPRAASMVVPAVANLRQAGVSTGLTPRSVRGPLSSRTPRGLGVAGIDAICIAAWQPLSADRRSGQHEV